MPFCVIFFILKAAGTKVQMMTAVVGEFSGMPLSALVGEGRYCLSVIFF